MPIDRKEWISPFNHLPSWLCGRCGTGRLSRRDADATKGTETRASRANRSGIEHSPEWMEHRFATLIACDNSACGEVVSVTGWREEFEDCMPDNSGDYWRERVRIDSVLPAPMPISLPKNVPDRIRSPIERTAKLYWISSAAAGNSLRQAVERYMDFKGVKATAIKPNAQPGRKRRRLTLGERFQDFEKRLKGDASLLSAIRWLGNVASHEGDLDRDHVLTAFEMLELVLEDQFVGHRNRLAKKAQQIERTKGKLARAE